VIGSRTSVGAQFFRDLARGNYASGRGLPAGSGTIAGARTTEARDTAIEARSIGSYIEQEVNLRERLFVTGALRFDDNSAFGENFNATVYPKASVSWLLSDEPFFDIETETRVRVPGDTYRVTVRATGPPDRLALDFISDPPLSEVEVLALLLGDLAPGRDVEFLQYTTDVTPQQQLLRERATRALTGALSTEVGRVVEQAFGIDTFQLTPSLVDPQQQSSRLDPAARLTFGKRLSDRAYLTYSRTISSSTSDQIFLLEYDQTDRMSWILSRNEDRTYAVEFRVRRTF
jgi:hypothetical protein